MCQMPDKRRRRKQKISVHTPKNDRSHVYLRMESLALPAHVQKLLDDLLAECDEYAARCAAIALTGIAMSEGLSREVRLHRAVCDMRSVGEYVTNDLRRTVAICETQIQDRIQAACFAHLLSYPMGSWNVLSRYDDCSKVTVRLDPDYDPEYAAYFEDFANREFFRTLGEMCRKVGAAVTMRDQQFMKLAEVVWPGSPPRDARWYA